jgi:alpha-L-fucosidase
LCSADVPEFEPLPEPVTPETLDSRPLPAWYDDAKFGIMIHWGLYSVPAWAETFYKPEEIFSDLAFLLANAEEILKRLPYVAWYENTLAIDGSPTQQFHRATYGTDFTYQDFQPLFENAAAKWNPDDWAELFRQAGARYVVLVTKHHDGYPLWPSEVANPRRAGWTSPRDIVGELTAAVRTQCMRMGLYYSGGIDWSFYLPPIATALDFLTSTPPDADYIPYADAHWRELIERYRPSILWNDIRYPDAAEAEVLFAEYYNTVTDGVINDRWSKATGEARHRDFITPEYSVLNEIAPEKWETVRGMGNSFAYNVNQRDEDYPLPESFVYMLVDIVSKNGNLLLNVGPMADGTIPAPQVTILETIGEWLARNGEAIYGTRPWERFGGTTAGGTAVRFTQKPASATVYATLLERIAAGPIEIQDFPCAPTSVRLLGSDAGIEWAYADGRLRVTLPEPEGGTLAPSFAIE